MIARNNLGQCLLELGELDGALGHAREAARLRPTPFTYAVWINGSLITDRPDEAEKIMGEALERGFDSPWLRFLQVRLAFLRKDDAAMERQWEWATGKPEAHSLFFGKAHGELHHGRLRAALSSAERAAALATAAGYPATYAAQTVLWQEEVGLSPTRPVTVASNETLAERLVGTLASARTGQLEAARRAANALRQEFSTHTSVQKYWLPLIEGVLELASNDAAGAVDALEPVVKYDLAYLGTFEPLYPSYIRGLAYLQAGEAARAGAEFQKILARPGLVGRGFMTPLATLQLARAQRAMGAGTAALASYETFLDLWQNADADIPLYAEAKAEHRELRDRLGSTAGPG
jgi:tetratricopeptide (TPR) repeat protein